MGKRLSQMASQDRFVGENGVVCERLADPTKHGRIFYWAFEVESGKHVYPLQTGASGHQAALKEFDMV